MRRRRSVTSDAQAQSGTQTHSSGDACRKPAVDADDDDPTYRSSSPTGANGERFRQQPASLSPKLDTLLRWRQRALLLVVDKTERAERLFCKARASR